MRDLSESHARIDIRYVGGLQLVAPRIRVFIDGECAGGLDVADQRAQPFLVTPGSHAVGLKCIYWRSETWDVDLSAGEKSTFRCAFRREGERGFVLSSAMVLAATPLSMVGFPLTGLAVVGLAAVGMAFAYWREWTTPGAYLSLRPQAEF